MTEPVYLQPELKDIAENLRRFLITNHDKHCSILGMLVAFDENDEPIKEKNLIFACGEKDVLLECVKILRKHIKECSDENGYVDIGKDKEMEE